MKLAQLIKKKAVVLGYGREGQATHRLLSQHKDMAALPVWVESDGSVGDGASGLGESLICRAFDQGLMEFDVAIRSPGIPVDHHALSAFRQAGGEVLNPSSIFFSERPNATVIGVTGSKGKSTTSSLLAHLINHSEQTAVLAGNIGRPLVGLLDATATSSDERSADVVVAELSSYQLCDLDGHLSLSLITRLFPEHIDWHGSVAAYYAAKMRMFELTRDQKVLVNARDPILMSEVNERPSAISVNPWPDEAAGALHRSDQSLVVDDEIVLRSSEWALAGRHNLDNAVMALGALAHLGLDAKQLAPSLAHFTGLPHRLQGIDGPQAIRWINDSIATTPHATKAALESLEGQAIVLLVGGHERGGDWSVVIDHLKRWPLAGLVALPDNGARIIEALSAQGVLEHCPVSQADDMMQAIHHAQQMALSIKSQSDRSVTVLLSPGAPSFGHYQNFEHRGEAFVRGIGLLDSSD
ncbi:MAG TPA: UDP-N-acetylmuramoyl-L-alanine--D-glutamate ligase [Wenzhouxiangella sp.]